MSKPIRWLLICAFFCVACNNIDSKANKSFAELQGQIRDVDLLQKWAQSVVESTNPSEAFARAGQQIPTNLLKYPGQPPPRLELVQLGTEREDWFVQVNGGFGLVYYGIALAGTNFHFPQDYKVKALKPGVFYFYAAN